MADSVLERKKFLRSKSRPLTIAFTAIADFSSFIGQEYIAGIMQACRDYGLNFINLADAVNHSMFMDFQFLPQYLAKASFMKAPLLDGLVTWASSLRTYMDNEKVKSFFTQLHPLPMVDIGYLDIPGVSSIRISNESSLELLVKHLVQVHKAKRIAFVYSGFSRPHEERYIFFKSQMQKAGLKVIESDIFRTNSLDQSDIERTSEALFQQYWGQKSSKKEEKSEIPDAIITSSDIIASRLIDVLESHGISVGEDIAVTGFNNQLSGLAAPSPVTTIDLAYFKRAYGAVELLIDQIMDPKLPKEEMTVPTRLVIRQSCGCFEKNVLSSFKKSKDNFLPLPDDPKNPQQIKDYLQKLVSEALKEENPEQDLEHNSALVSAIFQDIFQNKDLASDENSIPKVLIWWRNYLKYRKLHTQQVNIKSSKVLTKTLSYLRKGINLLIEQEIDKVKKWEDICTAILALEIENLQYDNILHAGENLSINDMASLAVNFSSIENESQLEAVLKTRLSSLKIPGIVLALSPTLSGNLSQTDIKIAIPRPSEEIAGKLPLRIREPAFFPHSLFQKASQVKLEILYHNEKFLGFAFMTLGNKNFALYDSVKDLLSQTIYNLYIKAGKTQGGKLSLTDKFNLATTTGLPYARQEASQSPVFSDEEKLSAQSLMDYLMDHLNEMTDLRKISEYFGLNESYLSRRVKELTGSNLQTLHEKLKIEQAKNLIKNSDFKINEIASHLGFANSNYFSNVFKKVTGLSPVNWAKREK